ncbi:hypothetical protein HanRHA438_Chr14g0682291 [Helianthus annuus]|nr:hypothetical protein HanRHA438_Chr14g0682291 [Helianthus annuus]
MYPSILPPSNPPLSLKPANLISSSLIKSPATHVHSDQTSDGSQLGIQVSRISF